MPETAPPIPSAIWARIVQFIREGRTGEVVINVHQGRVSNASIKERIDERERSSVQ